MALPQQKLREIILQLIFSHEFHESDENELMTFLMKEHKVSKAALRQAVEMFQKIINSKNELDAMIMQVSHSYDLGRIHHVERNILRLLVFEYFVEKSLPDKVAIAEAKRLARKFSADDAAGFVQALLCALIERK